MNDFAVVEGGWACREAELCQGLIAELSLYSGDHGFTFVRES
jgi:hypothetical protein